MLPEVIAEAVRSTVAGEQAAAGFVISTVGAALIVTVTGIGADAQPAAVVPTI